MLMLGDPSCRTIFNRNKIKFKGKVKEERVNGSNIKHLQLNKIK